MKTTGESYSTARRHVIARAAKTGTPPAATTRQQPLADHAAIAGISDDRIKRQTGHAWAAWINVLDAEGAETMVHRDIARLIHEKYNLPGWWSQTVTVGYERLKGRRERGQRIDGAYEVSKTRTFPVSVGTLFDNFADDRARRRWIGSVRATVRKATSPKSMRLQWPDGTIVACLFTSKGTTKSVVSLAHTKLTTRSAMEKTKADWSTRFDTLARLLARENR
jgi:hypothetical protein